MNSPISNLLAGLIAVFVVSVVAILANLYYVLWRRWRFGRQNPAGEPDFFGDPHTSPSKELIYFFCWKNQPRIEPVRAPSFRSSDPQNSLPESVEPLKWQGLHGPSRILFTIKEDEREELESEKSTLERNLKKRVFLEECFRVTPDEPAAATATVESLEKTETPFSTPCASPPYYTPSPSPLHEVQTSVGELSDLPEGSNSVVLGVGEVQRESPENGFYREKKGSFVTLEIHGG